MRKNKLTKKCRLRNCCVIRSISKLLNMHSISRSSISISSSTYCMRPLLLLFNGRTTTTTLFWHAVCFLHIDLHTTLMRKYTSTRANTYACTTNTRTRARCTHAHKHFNVIRASTEVAEKLRWFYWLFSKRISKLASRICLSFPFSSRPVVWQASSWILLVK